MYCLWKPTTVLNFKSVPRLEVGLNGSEDSLTLSLKTDGNRKRYTLNRNSSLVINIIDVPTSISAIICQAHAQTENLTLSEQPKVFVHNSITGKNIGLVIKLRNFESERQVWLSNLNQEDVPVLIVITALDSFGPIPGGCNMEFPTEIAPYLRFKSDSLKVYLEFQHASFGSRRDEPPTKCSFSLPYITYDIYVLFLEENDFGESEFFKKVEYMSNVSSIKEHSSKAKSYSLHPDTRFSFLLYPNLGVVYNVIAKFTLNNEIKEAAYVPVVSYGCSSFDFTENGCRIKYSFKGKLFLFLLSIYGFIVAFFGHSFISGAKVYSEFSVVSTDYASNLDPIQHPSMADTSNSVYMRCGKSVNELVMRLGALQYEEINITISNADKSKKMPQTNPFLVQDFIKKSINRHQQIDNMRYTRKDLIWENISARFLVADIPTTTPLEELSKEIQDKNGCLVVEMRHFVKPNSSKVTSPVLITILGTTVPETIKFWFIRQRIQPFVDRPRQCNKCYVYMHGARTCDKNNICFCCGGDHIGPCHQPPKCVNCSGSHNAKSRSCPVYIQEQKILELMCRNHISIGEARHIFRQKNYNYAESVKTMPAICNIEESINAKFESLLKTVNDRFEQQMQLFVDMLQKSMNCILQNFFKIFEQSVDPNLSAACKKKFLSKLNQISSTFSTWDAGGSSEVEQMSLN
ncbi:Transmembrane 7 superfamily member 3 [Araneus ventricosus]|uniref:Transmembrane 7 superfamily member 3 n=1 Tax=Araneus ventricosus TaxID=182803 RepID=A0A4Y2BA40_ARAVE|nr:Transmembrane 7 superfamily member 3 [Araneus ventricosus]